LARWRKLLPPPSPPVPVGARSGVARPLAGLGLLCLACATGQIGGEIDLNEPSAETFASCTVTAEVPVDLDDPALDFDAESLLHELASVVSHEPLAWGSALPETLVLTPAPGTTTIDIEVAPIDDSLRRLEREAPTGAEADGNEAGSPTKDDVAPDCSPLVAFDADVTLTAENGAFSDTFRAMFVVWSPELVTTAFEVMPGQLDGTFDLGTASGPASGRGRFELAWADGRLSGNLSGSVEDGNSVSNAELARFPADGCLVGHDLPSTSTLAEKAEETVSALDEFSLEWPEGTSTLLSLSSDFGASCLTSIEPTTVLLPFRASAVSSDGGVDGEWDLAANVGFDAEGEVAWVEVTRPDLAPVEAEAFAEATGITGISVASTSRVTFNLELSDQVEDAEPAEGALTVFESRAGTCEEIPPDPAPDGSSSPGCSGEELVSIGRAALTSVD